MLRDLTQPLAGKKKGTRQGPFLAVYFNPFKEMKASFMIRGKYASSSTIF